jgi:hypothetical protein
LAKDLTAFTARYGGMPSGVQVLGGYSGRLSNDGERLRLSMPGDVNSDGERQYIHIDLTEPDGYGKSLSRKVTTDYGNDVANWQAAAPSPGLANP